MRRPRKKQVVALPRLASCGLRELNTRYEFCPPFHILKLTYGCLVSLVSFSLNLFPLLIYSWNCRTHFRFSRGFLHKCKESTIIVYRVDLLKGDC